MDITIYPKKISGVINAIASKSHAHRLLICAAFADQPTEITCQQTNRDIEATVDCLNALGACIRRTDSGYYVSPAAAVPARAVLNCCESGSTLRFMLPIAGALGVEATFLMEGRLPERPLSPLYEEMERMGCQFSRPAKNTLVCHGKLQSGIYTVDGSVSSQFITGLLLAFPLMHGESKVVVTGKLESRPYIALTQSAMAQFGVQSAEYAIAANSKFISPGTAIVEGDWSNAAFFLTAASIGNQIRVKNLSYDSAQGDKQVAVLLTALNEATKIDAADIPDLVPILSVAAACKHGAVFHNIQRLRIKESDRVASVIAMITALGGSAYATQDTLTVLPCIFTGGTVDSFGDHRIAMSAAIAATVSQKSVTILGAECAGKSYRTFWDEYQRLGGNYEQHIR